MKTENKIEELFKQTMNSFSNEELNTLFINSFDMIVWTNKDNQRYLSLDDHDDKEILINEECSLFYYYTKAQVMYKYRIELNSQNELKRQINALIKL